jgi:hypothetical protein
MALDRPAGPAVKIGEVVRSLGPGRIVASNHPDFAVGDIVSGLDKLPPGAPLHRSPQEGPGCVPKPAERRRRQYKYQLDQVKYQIDQIGATDPSRQRALAAPSFRAEILSACIGLGHRSSDRHPCMFERPPKGAAFFVGEHEDRVELNLRRFTPNLGSEPVQPIVFRPWAPYPAGRDDRRSVRFGRCAGP